MIAAILPFVVLASPARRRISSAQGDVVLLEDLPDEVVLAGEVAVERALREVDPPGDVADGGAVDALLDEEVDGGGFDAVPGIDEAMAWHGSRSSVGSSPAHAPHCACVEYA